MLQPYRLHISIYHALPGRCPGLLHLQSFGLMKMLCTKDSEISLSSQCLDHVAALQAAYFHLSCPPRALPWAVAPSVLRTDENALYEGFRNFSFVTMSGSCCSLTGCIFPFIMPSQGVALGCCTFSPSD